MVSRKPKWGSTNQEISRYVYEKYIKRKFVKDTDQPDPLTLYKQNKTLPKPPEPKQETKKTAPQPKSVETKQKPVVVPEKRVQKQ